MSTPDYRRLTPLFLGLLILLLVGGTWYRHQLWRDKEALFLESSRMQLETAFGAGVNMFFLATNIYFDEIIDRAEIRQQMTTAMASDGQARDLARGRLYRLIYPSYERLSKRNLRHLHFHLPDGTSFLRFHQPEYYGDYLLDTYPAIRLSTALQQSVHGYETGKSGGAFRNIFLLKDDQGKFIGSVDLSVSFEALHDELKTLMPEREFSFILDRHPAENTLTDLHSFYTEAPLHPDFIIKDVHNAPPGSLQQPTETATLINVKLRANPQMQTRIRQPHSFSVKVAADRNSHAVDLLRIYDAEGLPVGYVVSYTRVSLLDNLKNEYLLGLTIVWGLSFGLGLLFVLLARYHDEMARLASTDVLTNLPNRRSFMATLTQELERFRRYGNPAALLMVDIDHFKQFNDTHGHATGDEVLRKFAGTLTKSLRQVDCAGRLGGEEFAVLLPGTGREGARQFAERLLGETSGEQKQTSGGHLFSTDVGPLKITVSIGVTCFSEEDTSIDLILSRADDALYQAKGNGRNRAEMV